MTICLEMHATIWLSGAWIIFMSGESPPGAALEKMVAHVATSWLRSRSSRVRARLPLLPLQSPLLKALFRLIPKDMLWVNVPIMRVIWGYLLLHLDSTGSKPHDDTCRGTWTTDPLWNRLKKLSLSSREEKRGLPWWSLCSFCCGMASHRLCEALRMSVPDLSAEVQHLVLAG